MCRLIRRSELAAGHGVALPTVAKSLATPLDGPGDRNDHYNRSHDRYDENEQLPTGHFFHLTDLLMRIPCNHSMPLLAANTEADPLLLLLL